MIAAQVETNKLCRQLATLEVIIKEMFSIRLPTSILKEKMAQAEATVMQLPEDNEFLILQWRNKVAGWYKEYAQLLVPEVVAPVANGDATATATNNSPMQPAAGKRPISKTNVPKVASHYSMPSTSRAPPPSPPPSAQIETEKPAADDDWMAKPAESFNWCQTSSNAGPKTMNDSTEPPAPLLRPPPHDLYGVEDHGQANGGNVFNRRRQYRKNWNFEEENLKKALLQAITQLPPVDVFDFPNLKRLSKVVNDIDKQLNACYWEDRYLQMTLLDALQAKLPPAKWEQYMAFIGDADNSIRNLKRFIVRQHRIIYNLNKNASEVKVASRDDQANDGTTTGDNFCKNTGHYMTNFPKICYICFDDSHEQESCPTKRTKMITTTNQQTNGGW